MYKGRKAQKSRIFFGGSAVKKSLWGWVLLCILSTVTLGFAQIATTSLRGSVTDPSGALVPGAKITLTNNATGVVTTGVANSAGNYLFPQLPPAKYTITVTSTGFGDQSKSAELLVNQPATINFTLTIQSSSVTVDVSATAQTLNLADATIGNSVGNTMIQEMPMDGRDPVSILSLQPGVLYLGNVNSATDSRQGSVAGSRSDQGNVTLDGIDDNNETTGVAFTGVLRSTMDSTEEFRVTTSNATAAAGRSSGAQVTLVTKSGTNKFHGALYEYYRPTNTVANDWFLKNSQISSGEPNMPDHYVQNVFGGSLGGPIKKDKLFFFFNYEGFRKAIYQTASRTVPTAPFYNTGANDNVLGYADDTGGTTWLTASQVATLDAACTQCSAPGVNPLVQQYFSGIPTIQPGQGSQSGDGINSGAYVFSSPRPSTLNTSILKLDYNLNASNHIFGRGNLQKDTDVGNEQFPGQGPSNTHIDNTKGMAFGYTWTPTPNMVNDIRYGYVRQGYSDTGVGQGDYVVFRFYDQPTAQTRDSITDVPVNSIVENFNWSKGNHAISIGGTWRGVQNNFVSNGNSFNSASTNPYWLHGDPPDPAAVLGLPGVAGGFSNSWGIAYSTLLGNVPELDGQFNYEVTDPTTATLLADGTTIGRHFHENDFEYYIQDSWRVRPNLTITFGLRHTILQTPYDTKGQQVSPTVDTDSWYKGRQAAALQGDVNQPLLSFAPSGKANHAPAYWPKQKTNFAPRASIVYSPDSKTSIRAGAGIFFDHYGQALVQSFDQAGSFGLSTALANPAGVYSYDTAPRFTGPHDLPNIDLGTTVDQTQTFPYTPPADAFLITWGMNNHIKTPYSESLDFSIQREMPGGFLVEAAYVGRMGRHLLQQIDLAEPVNYNDPKGGGDYFTAGAQLSKDSDENGGNYGGIFTDNPAVHVPTIQYFEDVFPGFKNFDYMGESATDAIYNAEWAPYRYSWGATTSLADIDFAPYCDYYYGEACNSQSLFWQSQFSSLYAWDSIGMSSYNALQVTVRHPQTHGLTADLNYTFSKSIDMGSLTERANLFSNDVGGGGASAIQNTWNPSLNRAVSDFDTRHLLTFDWSYQMPIGTGKAVLSNANRIADALIGGWQWAGIGRWSSGLPFSVYEPGWTTNWELEGTGVVTDPVKIKKHVLNGAPQVFAGTSANDINEGVYNGTPIRLPYPGEAGERNFFRGDGYINLDSSLTKSWKLAELARLKFAWEVYNVTNTPRFDVGTMNTQLTQGGLGYYSSMLTQYRHMQFGLRLDF
jgi:hypothetical protein